MAHILLFDVPGGNDFAVLEDALAVGHEVSFCTSDLQHYTAMGPEIGKYLAKALHVVEVPDFEPAALLARLADIHAHTPFHALICLLDIRLAAAANVAQALGLRFLSPAVVALTRNKTAVRERLRQKGISQPGFAQAATPDELRLALEKTGYPAIVKPSDGYGSENLHYVAGPDAGDQLASKLFENPEGYDYGLGVYANRVYSVEPYMQGALIGVDVFSDGNARLMLGINAKRMFPPPSFAIAGSCFPSDQFDQEIIRDFAFGVLDALDYDFGAAHIEIIVQEERLYLVEVNARLVSAQIPYQMSYAFERSMYVDLIDLHLGTPVQEMIPFVRQGFSVIRWVTAHQTGELAALDLPETEDPHIHRVVLFKGIGEEVHPPLANADRLGYVIATGSTEAEATQRAEAYIAAINVRIAQCSPCSS